jgi:hypothetical protein
MKTLLTLVMSFFMVETATANFVRMPNNIRLPSQEVISKTKRSAPASASTVNILNGVDGASSASAATVSSFLAQPDVPRNLVITPGSTTADVAAGDVTVYGRNEKGSSISEAFTFTANQSTAVTGNKAFAKIDRIVFPGEDSPFGATWSVGVGDKLGLSHCIDGSGWVIKGLVDNAALTGITMATSATALESNTFIPDPAANGARVFHVFAIDNFRCR